MGTVVIGTPYLDRWYFESIVGALTRALGAAGHVPRLRVRAPEAMSRADASAEIAADLGEPDVLGAVLVSVRYHSDRALAELDKPLVSIGGSQRGFPTVMIDDIGAARMATEYLVRLGHRRIAHLAGDTTDQMDFAVHGRRMKGYGVAIAGAGLEPDIHPIPFDPDAAYRATAAMLAREARPTAIFAVSDEMALPAMAAIRDAGLKVGDDVSIVGFDDHPRAAEADLTTVRQDPAALGAAAVQLLLSRLEHGGHGDDGSRLVPVSLVERGSSRRPGAFPRPLA